MILKTLSWCFQEMYSFPFISGGYCLLADLHALSHVTDSLPLEEPELPEDERDDDQHQEAGHDGHDHNPDGDVGNAGV